MSFSAGLRCVTLTPPSNTHTHTQTQHTPSSGSRSGHMDTSSLFFLYSPELLNDMFSFTHIYSWAVYRMDSPTSCCLSPTIQAAHPPLCLHPPFSACHPFFISVHSLPSVTCLYSPFALLLTASPLSALLRVQGAVSEQQCIVGHDPLDRTHFSAAAQTAADTHLSTHQRSDTE